MTPARKVQLVIHVKTEQERCIAIERQFILNMVRLYLTKHEVHDRRILIGELGIILRQAVKETPADVPA